MRFDRFDTSDFATKALLPDGQHEVEITKVKEVIIKADGKAKLVLTMEATAGDYAAVERWLDPTDKRDSRMAIQLLAALGLPAETEIDNGLVGRRVAVTTKAGTKKTTGEPVVYINDFSSSESSYEQDAANDKTAAKPARKTAAAKTLGEDDIPF